MFQPVAAAIRSLRFVRRAAAVIVTAIATAMKNQMTAAAVIMTATARMRTAGAATITMTAAAVMTIPKVRQTAAVVMTAVAKRIRTRTAAIRMAAEIEVWLCRMSFVSAGLESGKSTTVRVLY